MDETRASIRMGATGEVIEASGDNAFEQAQKLLKVSDLDRDEVEEVRIELRTETGEESGDDDEWSPAETVRDDPEAPPCSVCDSDSEPDADGDGGAEADEDTADESAFNGLKSYDYDLLDVFAEKDRFLTHSEVYDHAKSRFDIAETTARNRIQKLARDGYLDRQQSDDDARMFVYKITGKGRHALDVRPD